MGMTNKIGPKVNPYNTISKQAEGALTENSFVTQGTTQDECKPIATTGNIKILGFVDRAYIDNDMVTVYYEGTFDAIAEGTVTMDAILITGDGVGTVKDSAGTEDPRNQVGRALHGASAGQRVEFRLDINTERT